MSFAKEAWPFVLPFACAAGLLLFVGHPRWAAAAFCAGVLVLLFFRDPARRFDGLPAFPTPMRCSSCWRPTPA